MIGQSIRIAAAGTHSVVGTYTERDPRIIPRGFAKVCDEMRWSPLPTWQKLADQSRPWFEAPNGAYMYFNVGDGNWWIDEPGGAGVYISMSNTPLPPVDGWKALPNAATPLPELQVETAAA
jgi:hypothetical protein